MYSDSVRNEGKRRPTFALYINATLPISLRSLRKSLRPCIITDTWMKITAVVFVWERGQQRRRKYGCNGGTNAVSNGTRKASKSRLTGEILPRYMHLKFRMDDYNFQWRWSLLCSCQWLWWRLFFIWCLLIINAATYWIITASASAHCTPEPDTSRCIAYLDPGANGWVHLRADL